MNKNDELTKEWFHKDGSDIGIVKYMTKIKKKLTVTQKRDKKKAKKI